MKEKKLALTLQLFNEGFAGGGESGDGSTDGLANHETEEKEVVYGIQDDEPVQTEPEVETDNPQTEGSEGSDDNYESFRAKYKNEIGKEIQDAISRRFKNSKDVESQLTQLTDLIAPFYQKYGIKDGDVQALTDAMNKDTTLFEDVAEQNGMTHEAWQRMQRMERENQRLNAQKQQAEIAEKARKDYEGWVSQAEDLRALYPNFDLAKECENQDFVNDLKAGKSVRKAYEAAHLDEILAGAIQHTADNVRKNVTDTIKARGMRPAENGSTARAGVVVKDDVNSLTDKDIDAILRQVKAGKKIKF
jgi:hypothetical protein